MGVFLLDTQELSLLVAALLLLESSPCTPRPYVQKRLVFKLGMHFSPGLQVYSICRPSFIVQRWMLDP